MGNTSPQKTSRRPSQKQDHCFLGKEHMWVKRRGWEEQHRAT